MLMNVGWDSTIAILKLSAQIPMDLSVATADVAIKAMVALFVRVLVIMSVYMAFVRESLNILANAILDGQEMIVQ